MLVRVTLGALGLLPAGCGCGGPGQITLGYLTWHENVAVSSLREEFAFVAWEPHWMNESYELDYLEDPKGALGTLTEPSDVSTLVREDLAEEDPVAYAFMDSTELTEAEITGLQTEIQEAGDPTKGAKTWLEENRDVVEPWVEAAEKAREG